MTTLSGPRLSFWQTVRYVRNPLAFYLDCVSRYGDRFSVPTLLGPVVVISHPLDIKALFAMPVTDFERWSVEAVEPLLGKSAVMLTSGEVHLAQRRQIAPALHKEYVTNLAASIMAVAEQHANSWPTDRPLLLQEVLIDLSIDVIVCSVLGIKDSARALQLRLAIRTTLSRMNAPMMLARMLFKGLDKSGPYARFCQARDALDVLLFEEIDAQRTDDSMLALLRQAGFDRSDLRDQLMTLIFAGHETSAINLSWSIYWLQKNPECLTKLRSELESTDHLDERPCLDAVCKESLRLIPAVPEVIRKLSQPLRLPDIQLPSGTVVAACIAATHRREDIYPEAGQFRPERFLQQRFGNHEYLPFGGGLHRCAGEAFAWMEIKIILSTLLRCLRFKLLDTQAVTPRLRSITMEPRGGIPVTVQRND